MSKPHRGSRYLLQNRLRKKRLRIQRIGDSDKGFHSYKEKVPENATE